MITVEELKNYQDELLAALDQVNTAQLVLDESEVVKILKDMAEADNQIMLVVMPDARTNARDEDSIIMNNALGFLFLEKTDYKMGSAEWIDLFKRTQETALAFVRKLIQDKTYGSCDFHRYLNVNNISIEPVTSIASCNGWTVEVYFSIPF